MPVNHRLHLVLVNLLYDERHCNDDVRMDFTESLEYYFRARGAGKEVDVGSDNHFVNEFEHEPVHVGGRQHGHDFALTVHLRLSHLSGKPGVGVESPVRNHHSLGEA